VDDRLRGETGYLPMRALRSSLGLGSLLVAALIVVAVGVGTVYAAIPNGNAKYFACLAKATGTVRLINYPRVKTCPNGQKLIDWNARGPQGRAGSAGPAGASGSSSWNDIGNKPAGFADGVDDIGPTYSSSIIFTTTSPLAYQNTAVVEVTLPGNIDYQITLIPTNPGAYLTSESTWVRRNADGTLARQFLVKNLSVDATPFKLRGTAFADGIAPAVLKQQLKNVRVTIKKVRSK
jgi:hypothetical protein